MATQQHSPSDAPRATVPVNAVPEALRFAPDDRFRNALRRRVDFYFMDTGRSPRGSRAMRQKTAVVLAAFALLYSVLVFAAPPWWLAVPLAVLLGLTLAAIGFNVQHDGSHRAYSRYKWANELAALSLDLLGGSSYIWVRKHNAIHHSYTNVTGQDDDINIGILGRLSPHQPRRRLHGLQHIYLWLLYGLLAIKWHLYDDFHNLLVGRIGRYRLARPRGRDLTLFLAGKVVFFTLAFGVPMLLHPWWVVLVFYAAASYVEGVVLSVVFQLAHCVEEAEFPLPHPDTQRLPGTWAEHQVQTTVDFAPHNRLLTWYAGGLNFQIEHHLFPQVCHVHYPVLAPLVRQTCAEFGLRYAVNPTLRAGIASHYRWLRRMGRPTADLDGAVGSRPPIPLPQQEHDPFVCT